MLKKQSKKLALLLVLCMVASLFVGVGSASAANGVSVSVSRVKSAKSDEGKVQIGDLQIKEDSDYPDAFASGDSFIVTLPSNLKWQKDSAGNYVAKAAATAAGLDVEISGNYTMTVKILGSALTTTAAESFTLPLYVNFDDVEEGYAYVTIDGLDSPVPSGDYAVANVLSGGTSAAATDTFTAGPDTGGQKFTFRLTESAVGTFMKSGAKVDEKVVMTLPKKVKFTNLVVTGLGGFNGTANLSSTTATGASVFTVNDDKNKVTFNLQNLPITYTNSGDTARGILEFVATVNIESDASTGAVNLEIDGNDKVNDTTIKVGTVADYGTALSALDPKTVLAGSVCKELGKVVIYENVKDTLTSNRTIKIELPDGVKFSKKLTGGNNWVKKGSVNTTASNLISDSDEKSVTLRPNINAGSARVKIEVPMEKMNIAADFVGDVVVKVSGRAGVEGEVVIGTVVAPVEVSVASVADVKIGYQGQALSDIVITETEGAALLEKGTFKIELPSGVEFEDQEAVVKVTNGNMSIKNVKVKGPVGNANAYVQFDIDSPSSKSQPSTITVSNLYLDVDRTVAEGPIKAIVTGSAVAVSDKANRTTTAFNNEYDAGTYGTDWNDDYLFDNKGEAGRFVIANCVTPGVGEVTSGAVGATSTFVIGSTAAVIAGSDSVMPVAPYISNSRTLLPVRYVAYACGVPEANVIWNPDNQTVTLLNNNGTVVQLTIGSSTMQVNGVAVIMDVAPQITNGYTFLPARYVANAFGYDASWEAATQTVTISPIQ